MQSGGFHSNFCIKLFRKVAFGRFLSQFRLMIAMETMTDTNFTLSFPFAVSSSMNAKSQYHQVTGKKLSQIEIFTFLV